MSGWQCLRRPLRRTRRVRCQIGTDAMLDVLMKVALVLFMAGSLLDMGLGLKLRDALTGLRDIRFLGLGLTFGFILGPLLALVLTWIIPLEEPYAIGLLLLGLTPCAPFLPGMVTRAQGDMNYAAAMLLLAAVGTVVILPLAVPFVAPSLTADAWSIARPLLIVVLLPLVLGIAVFSGAPETAAAIRPIVRKVTAIATIAVLVLCVALYGQGFMRAVGSYAIGAQIAFFVILTAASYLLSGGLPKSRRSVLALGMCTRNVGAAMVPLFSATAIDPRAMIMVVLGVPMQLIFALLAARWFARDAERISG